jgi:hypothetical protein
MLWSVSPDDPSHTHETVCTTRTLQELAETRRLALRIRPVGSSWQLQSG